MFPVKESAALFDPQTAHLQTSLFGIQDPCGSGEGMATCITTVVLGCGHPYRSRRVLRGAGRVEAGTLRKGQLTLPVVRC